MVAIPQHRVRRLLRNEDEVIADLQDLERREEDRRASAARDMDKDGRGEYAPLGDVLGVRTPQFERVEGTDIWRRGGYYFTVLLPNREKRPVPALSADVHTDYAELSELLVAWPADPGRSGMRAYVIWPGGQLLQHAIDGYPYTRDPPVPDAAIIGVAGGVAKPADRYDRKDWVAPSFTTGKRAAPAK
jgi:hypothetical protein